MGANLVVKRVDLHVGFLHLAIDGGLVTIVEGNYRVSVREGGL